MKFPPGPRGRKVLGFLGGGTASGTVRFLEETARQYGPISSFRLLNKRICIVDDADLINEVLVTRQHEFVRDSGATLLRELVGDGLLTRDEPQHRERRRVLQPAFHRAQVESYADLMVDEAGRTGNEWHADGTIDVNVEMKRLTLGIVGASLFGVDCRDSALQIASVLQQVMKRSVWLAPGFAFLESFALAYRRAFPRGRSLIFQKQRKQLEAIIDPIIEQRRNARTKDVISLLLNAEVEPALKADDIRNEVVTFILAGHETTATALTWTWYLLARHPEVEAKFHEEIDTVLGDRRPVLDDAARLPYTAMIFKEAMRLHPPALAFGRRPVRHIVLGGYDIPRGASIFVSPFITQRNERYFAEPDSFKPDRWQELSSLPKFAYFPFGGGAKMCIGEQFARLEGLLALAVLGRKWKLSAVNADPVGVEASLVLRPEHPILMRLTQRNPKPEIMSQDNVEAASQSH
jgi:cytochrome P450